MLSDVLSAIHAEIAAIGGLPVPIVDDAAVAEDHVDVPRIVEVPSKDTFGMNVPMSSAGASRAIRTRFAGWEIHFWGATRSDTEILLHDYILAAQRQAYGTITLGSGTWNRRTRIAQRGFEYILNMTVEVPILDTPLTLAPSDTKATITLSIDTDPTVPGVTVVETMTGVG